MALLLPIMLIPLAILMTLALNLGGHWAHKTSEQVRLDALTLSLCHHRKNFIESKIFGINEKIERLQQLMDTTALPCFLAIGSPAAPAACEGVRATLRTLSRAGALLERAEDLAQVKYQKTQGGLRKQLQKENSLDRKSGDLVLTLPLTALGFSREVLSTRRSLMEAALQVQWPRQLLPDAFFDFAHTYRARFHPHRILVGVRKDSKRWHGLNPDEFKNLKTKEATSESGCKIERKSNDQLRVRRFL